jgi:hypothetical protein
MSDVIEIAPTGRAKCRRCQQKIDKGELRFGERVPNAFGEGDATHWYHPACAAEKRPEKLIAALDAHDGEIEGATALRELALAGAKNPKLAAIVRAEPAPTARATCQHCRQKIDKGSLRIVIEREADPSGMASLGSLHLACGRDYFGGDGLLDKLLRTSPELDAEQKSALVRALS